MKSGARNAITDVAGLKVGNADDDRVWSGVTVVLPDENAKAAVDVRGGAPGTRETDALDPSCLVGQAGGVHAIVLSGGSAFGLDAASGVTGWLAERGRGFKIGSTTVPIVPSAILFDLLNGGDKEWGGEPPYWYMAIDACENADLDFPLGNVGAGYGAKAFNLKGGLGTASIVLDGPDNITVGALVAANPVGSVIVPGTDKFYAAGLERDAEFGGYGPGVPTDISDQFQFNRSLGENTTIAVVATDLDLDASQLQRMAMMTHDGMARAVAPSHTPFDGDTVFALSTGGKSADVTPHLLAAVGMAAADCLARAIARAVYAGETLGPFPGYKEHFGKT